MSSIGSISSGAGAWSGASAVRNMRPPPGGANPAEMFAKVDADGSGGVDQTELQAVLDKVAKGTGGTAASSADTFAKFDTDGDGSLSQDELGEGMKSLMPAPSDTVAFAQGRCAGAGGPPPAGGDDSSSYDPLDTNQDGTVSAAEQAAGDATQAALESLMKAVDGNQDGQLSGSEVDSFKALADKVLQQYSALSQASQQDAGAQLSVEA